MNELRIFNDAQFGNIRAIGVDGKPYMSGGDVAKSLGYTNTRKAVREHVADNHKLRERIVPPGGQARNIIFIDEAGLYSLVLRSKLPKAEAFQEWVVSEVLPSIRNTGAYSTKPIEPTFSGIDTKTLAKMVAAELKIKQLPPAGSYIFCRTQDRQKRECIEKVVEYMSVMSTRYCELVEVFARTLA